MKGKTLGRIVAIGLVTGGGTTNGEYLDIICSSSLPLAYVEAGHVNGAKEPGKGPDGKDATFPSNPSNPRIDFYLVNNDGNFTVDARDPYSTSDFYARIEGVGIPGGSITANLSASIWDPSGEGNFDWKNLVIELYDNGVIGSTANKIGTYDGHDLAAGSTSLPELTIQNGLCYQLIIKPRHNADLDLNQRIGLGDLKGLVGLYWLAPGAGPGNRWNNLTDIDRDTITNLNDFGFIEYDWLWEQDPNLMSKLTESDK